MGTNIHVDFISSALGLNLLRSCHEAVTTREWRLFRASCNCCVGICRERTTVFCVLQSSSLSLSLLICIYFNNISKHHTTKQLCPLAAKRLEMRCRNYLSPNIVGIHSTHLNGQHLQITYMYAKQRKREDKRARAAP